MAELKTKPTDLSVDAFIDAIEPEWKKEDSQKILKLMKKITSENPVMWGSAIVGFGSYHYRYKSGREGDWFLTGFSPRKQSMTLYMAGCNDGSQDELIKKLGKYKKSVGCLYFKKLTDIDVLILEEIIEKSIESLKSSYEG